MANFPIGKHDHERVTALKSYQILDTSTEKEFDRLTELASIICNTPISLVSLLDENRQWFKSAIGTEVRETIRELAFCNYTILDDEIFEVPDASKDERFRNNALVTGDPNIRFYSGYPLTDNNGHTLGTLCVIDTIPRTLNDQQKRALQLLAEEVIALITERREKEVKEQKILDSENQFKVFFENAHGLMCMHDLQGDILMVNRASAANLGYTVKELTKLTLFDVVNPLFHDELTQYLQVIKIKGRMSGLMNTVHKDGSTRIWLFNNVLSENQEGQFNIIGNALDITERHELEMDFKKTKEMLEQTNAVARVGGWEVDLVKNEIFWSSITKEIHEVADDYIPEISTAVNFYEEGSSRDQITAALQEAIAYGTPYDLELELVTAKGRKVWVRTKGDTEVKNGITTRIYGIFQDIDGKKKAEIEITKAKHLAEQASMAKSEFLANMSHEIRTPLNGVIGFTDLVLKMNLTEAQQQYISIVNQSANALLVIINDILDFSKIEAGKLELDIERCDLFELGNQASDIVTYQAQNKSLELLLNIATDLPRFIWTDQIRLKQVLVNLLGNAAKFTEKGEIELRIAETHTSINETSIRFEVRDTGIGIKAEKQRTIFEAFSQEDASTTKKYGGTGLGLAISNKLLALMGSSLQLQSIPGKGSVFFFDLTVRSEHGEPIEWEKTAPIGKVLIVDDNENNRIILKQMLALKNISSGEAKDGFEALKILEHDPGYEIIMMDYHMPDMNGLETVKKIRKSQEHSARQAVILLHSSSDDEIIINSCKQLNIEQRLLKPIKIQEMYNALSTIFKKEQRQGSIQNQYRDQATKKPLKVLIAEDNVINMLLAKTIIKRINTGAIIMEATNGHEALEQCGKLLPDIIFMDIQMPEMNGYEAAREIRQIYKDHYIPIVAITAANLKGEKEKCTEAGMDDFIAKPFVENSIISILEKWTGPLP